MAKPNKKQQQKTTIDNTEANFIKRSKMTNEI